MFELALGLGISSNRLAQIKMLFQATCVPERKTFLRHFSQCLDGSKHVMSEDSKDDMDLTMKETKVRVCVYCARGRRGGEGA